MLANDSDPDGDTIGLISWTQAAHGFVTCLPSGLCTYTPAPDFHGDDSFTYRIDDGHGHTAGATVRVTVEPRADTVAPTSSIACDGGACSDGWYGAPSG